VFSDDLATARVCLVQWMIFDQGLLPKIASRITLAFHENFRKCHFCAFFTHTEKKNSEISKKLWGPSRKTRLIKVTSLGKKA